MDSSALHSAMYSVSPFFIIASGLLLFFAGFIKRIRSIIGYAALIASLVALFFTGFPAEPVGLFGGLAFADGQAVWIWSIILASLAGSAFVSISLDLQHPGTYYMLMFLSAAGCMFMAAADNLFFAFFAAEISTIPLYFLVSCRKGKQGLFAAYKLSASGLFLFALSLMGLSFLNHSCSSLSLAKMSQAGLPDGLALTGFLLFSSAFCLKMLAVPFNLVFKDVFSDSPAIISAFMSSAWAVSALPVLYKIYNLFYFGPVHNFFPVLALITAAFGAYQAFYGGNIRRIAFGCTCLGTGFSLLSFSGDASGGIALLYHLPAFAAGSAALFLFSMYFEKEELSLPMSGLAGFSEKHPVIAFAAAASLFSAAGLPPFGGFFAKSIILFSLLENGHFYIASAGCVFLFFACWCAIRIVSAVFFPQQAVSSSDNSKSKDKRVPVSAGFMIIVLSVFLMGYGVFSSYFLSKISAFMN